MNKYNELKELAHEKRCRYEEIEAEIERAKTEVKRLRAEFKKAVKEAIAAEKAAHKEFRKTL